MTYIVLDLEWDSAYFVPEKRFINQILQIGAVKLDEQFNIIDTFEKTIKSSISKRVSGRFSSLTGITSEDMRNGIPLQEGVNLYNEWVGDGAVTMTWSNSDLYTVVENQKSLLNGTKFKIEKYIDLQSFIQNEMRISGIEIKSQISLSDAAEKAEIVTDGYDMHTAKDDSIVCALILKKYYNKERFSELIKDTSKDGFFDKISYKPQFITDINDENVDKKELEFFCEICKNKLAQKSKWKYKNHCFFAFMYCENCKKKYRARISFKKTFDGIVTKKKLSVFMKRPPKITATAGENKNEMQSLSEKM